MSATAIVALLMLGAYLIGAIPFGLVVGWARGIDVRNAGSRNIGATNVSRLLGRKYGLLVFALDVLKGLIPTAVAGWVLIGLGGRVGPPEPVRYLCWLTIGAACVLGHNYPVYLGFAGGKGVSTSLGVTLGIYPDLTYPAIAAFVIWAIVVGASRYISAGSITAGIAFPILFVVVSRYRGGDVIGESWPLLAFSLLLALLVLVRHRVNLGRLLAGTESKIGRPATEPTHDAPP